MAENSENKIYEEEPKAKAVFKFGISKRLIEEFKHEVVGIKLNRDGSGNVVFFFKDSLQLRDDMQKIIKERRKQYTDPKNQRKEDEEAEKLTMED